MRSEINSCRTRSTGEPVRINFYFSYVVYITIRNSSDVILIINIVFSAWIPTRYWIGSLARAVVVWRTSKIVCVCVHNIMRKKQEATILSHTDVRTRVFFFLNLFIIYSFCVKVVRIGASKRTYFTRFIARTASHILSPYPFRNRRASRERSGVIYRRNRYVKCHHRRAAVAVIKTIALSWEFGRPEKGAPARR